MLRKRDVLASDSLVESPADEKWLTGETITIKVTDLASPLEMPPAGVDVT